MQNVRTSLVMKDEMFKKLAMHVYKITEILHVHTVSLVDRCVKMRVCKHNTA